MSKQGATIKGVKGLGLQLKGNAPADSNKLIRKDQLNNWYYVDNVAAGISSYPDNRIMTYEDLISASFVKPAKPFYTYDVTRSGIPGALERYFTYVGSDFQTYTIQQDAYGYVGNFCMQEDSYKNNSYGLYTITQVSVCYPYYGAYPQPYLNNCCLYFNNLGSYSVSDVKIYQLISVDNIKQDYTTYIGGASFLAAIPGLNFLWGAASLLVIIGGVVYGNGTHLSNQLRYAGSGGYTNGLACLTTYGSSAGTPQYYIAYKVKNSSGTIVAAFGYGSGESTPPGLTSSCVASGTGYSTAATWTSTGTTACVSCANIAVYRDTNSFSATAGKYKVNTNGAVVTGDPTSACDTTANWTYQYKNCLACINRDIFKDTNPCSATAGQYKINTDGTPSATIITNTGACNTTQSWEDNGTVICIGCSNVTVYRNNNACSGDYHFYRYTNPTTSATITQESDPSGTACDTSPNWVLKYYNCSSCITRSVERDENPCSDSYLGYTVNHGVNVGTTAPSNTGACSACCGQSTTRVWTATGEVRCVDCVSQIEQKQTNICATGYNTLRWINGGSNCSTTAHWVVLFGTYECVGCDQYFVEVDDNSCSGTYTNTRRGSLRFANTANCGDCCGSGVNTTPDWTILFGSYSCSGCNKYYNEVDLNSCSSTANQVRMSSLLVESNSSYCCTPVNNCIRYQITDYGWVSYTDCLDHEIYEYHYPNDTICATSIWSGYGYQLGDCDGYVPYQP